MSSTELCVLLWFYKLGAQNPETPEVLKRRKAFFAGCVLKAINAKDGGYLAIIRDRPGTSKACAILAENIQQGKVNLYVK